MTKYIRNTHHLITPTEMSTLMELRFPITFEKV